MPGKRRRDGAPREGSGKAPEQCRRDAGAPGGFLGNATPPTKDETAGQFGRNARAYAESYSHAQGQDLLILLGLLRPRQYMRVLDIATGAGHTALAVAPLVEQAWAADLTPEMIDQVKRLSAQRGVTNLTCLVADAEDLPFPGESFDAVTCRIAAHHFADVRRAVSEIARVLKPGGVFVLEDSCAPEAARQDGFINSLEKLRDPTHVRSYTRRQWKAMLAEAGLPVARLRNFRKQHNVADWLNRAGMDREGQRAVYQQLAAAPAWARKQFSITYEGSRAITFSDDKIILRAVKIGDARR